MIRRPTIIDVALAAGVSKSTVSLVLQASPTVREDTRALVRQAMADIGYVYNRTAANMRSANAGLIGLVINDLRNPFFTEFATSVQMALSARGYATVIANTNEDPVLQDQVVAAMVEHGVSALVISPSYGAVTGTFGTLARAGIPAMQVLRQVDARTDLFPFAAPDYSAGSRLATDHLLAMGARRIAFVGGVEGSAVAAERMSGYLAALAQADLPPTNLPGRASRAFGREAASILTGQSFDAALCFNDLVALGVLSGFAALGRPVGQDFRLVGFDDIEDSGQVFPGLTTVRCNIEGFGGQIATTILDWLEADKRPDPVTRTGVDLVIRASTSGA